MEEEEEKEESLNRSRDIDESSYKAVGPPRDFGAFDSITHDTVELLKEIDSEVPSCFFAMEQVMKEYREQMKNCFVAVTVLDVRVCGRVNVSC